MVPAAACVGKVPDFSCAEFWRRRKMNRVPKAEGRRKRILSDEEIRKVWHAGAANFAGTTYAAFVKLALLTGQRRDKLHSLRWDDIHGSIWIIRTEPREKGNPGQLRLPKIAMDIINSRPRFVELMAEWPADIRNHALKLWDDA